MQYRHPQFLATLNVGDKSGCPLFAKAWLAMPLGAVASNYTNLPIVR